MTHLLTDTLYFQHSSWYKQHANTYQGESMPPQVFHVVKAVLVAFIGALASIAIRHLENDGYQDHDQDY